MTRHVISTTVTNTVTLGSDGYGDNLRITDTGAVAPTTYGATAIVAPAALATARIANLGHVLGGAGQANDHGTDAAGAVGIDFEARGGGLANAGQIVGGYGGYGVFAGGGGAGILFGGNGRIDNSATIAGGQGAEGYNSAGEGGIGLEEHAGAAVDAAGDDAAVDAVHAYLHHFGR